MRIVIDSKLILVLQLCVLLQRGNGHHYDHIFQYSNEESQSQENNSDMEYREEHHHYGSTHHSKNNDNNKPSMSEPQIQIIPMAQMAQPQSSSLSQLSMPQLQMSLSQSQAQPMSQMQIPQMSMSQMPMSSMPQMSMPQMSMPSMSMSMMQMPTVRMPMQVPGAYPSTYPSTYQGQNLLYFPLSSQLTNYFKDMISKSNSPVQRMEQSSSVAVSSAGTTSISTTASTTTTTTTLPPTTKTKEKQDYKPNTTAYLKSRTDKSNMLLESVLKSALGGFANIIVKTPEKTSSGNNRYMLTSLRRTKPTWMPKFGIVPIPDNMANRIMSQMRVMKDIRRRPKREAKYFF